MGIGSLPKTVTLDGFPHTSNKRLSESEVTNYERNMEANIRL